MKIKFKKIMLASALAFGICLMMPQTMYANTIQDIFEKGHLWSVNLIIEMDGCTSYYVTTREGENLVYNIYADGTKTVNPY